MLAKPLALSGARRGAVRSVSDLVWISERTASAAVAVPTGSPDRQCIAVSLGRGEQRDVTGPIIEIWLPRAEVEQGAARVSQDLSGE